MSTRSGRIRPSAVELSPPKTRKGVSPPRSPARTRKSSPPARSPSRKSPSRKSPSRKPASKFPARKSPSRTTKETTETVQKSPAKRIPIKSDVDVKLVDFAKVDLSRSTRTRRVEYSIKDYSSVADEYASGDKVNGVESLLNSNDVFGLRNRRPAEEVAPRRSSRLKEFMDNTDDLKRSLSKSVSKSVSQSIDTYSDEEEDDIRRDKSQSVTRKLATPIRESVSKLAQISSRWEFGGRIGSAVLIVLLPATAFSILVSCSKSCSVKSLTDISLYKSVISKNSVLAVALMAAQYVLQAVFACLPVMGTKAEKMDDSGKKHNFNAFFASICTITLLFALDFTKVINADNILNDYVALASTSFACAIILSIILFWKSRKLDDSLLNPYGNTGYVVYDYWMGREIHPHFNQLDVKLWTSRICNINALILAVLIFKHGFHIPSIATENLNLESYQQVLGKIQYKPSILLFSMMQVIYILNFVLREYKVTTTFFWQSEGVGYMQLASSALYPFVFTTISKFVVDKGISLSANTLIAAAVLYVVGLLIMLISNNIKYEFRKNPLHPSLTHLDSMPTFHGKKLLVSNLWGILRHPNYAGDIMIHIALALPGIIAKEPVAAAPAVLTIIALLYRACRDHLRCKRRYGAAWQRYCKRVPSVLIPKIL